ncbi:hypothetical protein [Azospira restricta]|uniref:Uncharacterized protein n=1 Tax=Azospira restricta TaxID=404405 RepID=A0A974PWG7_9RHOO|nr:hypothetical protein [Azospira restricta]QRJ62403.1 hypothetical protein IWH25_11430 [Azospira restricta]
MAWTTRNSLNRWCLRSLHENSASPLPDLLGDADAGVAALARQRHKGRPPLMNSCVAPHCDAWRPLDAERGICLFREMVKAEIAGK